MEKCVHFNSFAAHLFNIPTFLFTAPHPLHVLTLLFQNYYNYNFNVPSFPQSSFHSVSLQILPCLDISSSLPLSYCLDISSSLPLSYCLLHAQSSHSAIIVPFILDKLKVMPMKHDYIREEFLLCLEYYT